MTFDTSSILSLNFDVPKTKNSSIIFHKLKKLYKGYKHLSAFETLYSIQPTWNQVVFKGLT